MAYRQGREEARPALEADYRAIAAATATKEDTHDEEPAEKEASDQEDEVFALIVPHAILSPREGGVTSASTSKRLSARSTG